MSPRLLLNYFDGRSARAQTAEIWLADGQLHLAALDHKSYDVAQVRWPERQRHGQRQVLLPDGGVLSSSDATAWDDWASAAGLRDSLTVRWMQSWRHVGSALLLLIVLLSAGWRWGVPLAADGMLALLPATVEQQVGERALSTFDRHLLKPSGLSAARQQALRQRFEQAARAALPATGAQPAYRLHFREAGKALGANAFALPGGDIVLTDALVELLADTPDAIIGVLAHELGHVQHRHGMRITVQAGIVGTVAGVIVGDFSAALAGAPALLSQASYSRDFERQADEYARRLLRGASIPPQVMTIFFERIEHKYKDGSVLPIAISSHPANEERVRFFKE